MRYALLVAFVASAVVRTAPAAAQALDEPTLQSMAADVAHVKLWNHLGFVGPWGGYDYYPAGNNLKRKHAVIVLRNADYSIWGQNEGNFRVNIDVWNLWPVTDCMTIGMQLLRDGHDPIVLQEGTSVPDADVVAALASDEAEALKQLKRIRTAVGEAPNIPKKR